MSAQMEQTKKYSIWVVVLGFALIILLTAYPLLTIKDSEFGGTDGAGSEVVTQIAPAYNSEWITNWWSPPGGETESMLFALQAAAGGVGIGYFFGFLNGRKKGREEQALTK
jgi:cobalt/nickel transport protein